MATHSSVPAWRIPGTGEPGGLLSMGSHRVEHDWSNLAAAAAGNYSIKCWAIHYRILWALNWSILDSLLFLFVLCSFDMCTRLRGKKKSVFGCVFHITSDINYNICVEQSPQNILIIYIVLNGKGLVRYSELFYWKYL